MTAYALSLPEAWEDHPWDETVFKVRKKVFVFMGSPGDEGLGFSVKLPDTFVDLLEEPFASPTGYGLGKAGWVSIRLRTGDEVTAEQALAWVEQSYRAVAPKTLARKLDAG
ncbi:MAG: MmcQ/YjbR family DNA-binding protein [Alphaproteobacteria bacterium]|nr:MmcQ/YjbR family DNA-binding protein [Alphaproteobacteria bacterium]